MGMTPQDRAWLGERLRRLDRRIALILCSLAFIIALLVGGMVAAILNAT